MRGGNDFHTGTSYLKLDQYTKKATEKSFSDEQKPCDTPFDINTILSKEYKSNYSRRNSRDGENTLQRSSGQNVVAIFGNNT